MTPAALGRGWSERGLLDLVTIKSGQVDPRKAEFRSLALIAPDHISSKTGRLIKLETAAAQQAISGKYLVKPGDVIYSKIRPYLQKAYRCNFEALCSADMYPLTPRPGVDGSFVLHSILGHDFTNFATSVSARSGIPKINREELAGYRLAVPPPAEQAAIGRALDDADDLVGALEGLIAKKQALKQGMMQQLLTGRTRLPGFGTAHPGWIELGDVAAVTMGQSPVGASYNRRGIGAPLINGPTEFTDHHPIPRQWTTSPVRYCRSGDVLICVRGSSTGRMNIADEEYCIGRGVAAVGAHESASQMFVRYALEWAVVDMLKLQAGSTFPSIDERAIRNSHVLDVSIEEQAAIGALLYDTDGELAVLRARLEKARGIKTGMMQELLSGRTRLPVEGDAV